MRNHELCFIRDTKYSLYSASTLAKIKQAQLYAVPTSPGKASPPHTSTNTYCPDASLYRNVMCRFFCGLQ